MALSEIRPERVDEDELCVRELPEEEVRDPELARSADEEIWLLHLGCIEAGGDCVFVDVPRIEAFVDDAAGGLDDLRAAAVVECDPEIEAVTAARLFLERRHLGLQPRRRPVTAPDEARADA